MIKILFVLNGSIKLGGTEKVVETIFDNIDKCKYHIDFMLHCRKEEQGNINFFVKLKNSTSKIYFVTPRRESVIKNRNEIYKILKNNRYDIVHTHMDGAGAVVLYYAKRCGCNIRIAHSHNTGHQIIQTGTKGKIYILIEEILRLMIKREANCYIACSTEASFWLFGKKLTESKKTYILKNAIDTKAFKFDEKSRQEIRSQLKIGNKIVVGTVGRICKQKNTIFLIEILRELVKRDKSVILLHIGPGDNTELVRKVKEYGIEEYIIFYGETEDIPAMLSAMDIYVFPSLWEGFGIAGLEAQANGLPIIMSTNIPKETGILDYKFLDINEGAKKWAQEILNTEMKFERSTAYLYLSKYQLDQDSYIKKLEYIYAKLIDQIN